MEKKESPKHKYLSRYFIQTDMKLEKTEFHSPKYPRAFENNKSQRIKIGYHIEEWRRSKTHRAGEAIRDRAVYFLFICVRGCGCMDVVGDGDGWLAAGLRKSASGTLPWRAQVPKYVFWTCCGIKG